MLKVYWETWSLARNCLVAIGYFSGHINRDAKGTHGVLGIDGVMALAKVMVVFRSIHRVENRGTLTESSLNGTRVPFIIKLLTALNSP